MLDCLQPRANTCPVCRWGDLLHVCLQSVSPRLPDPFHPVTHIAGGNGATVMCPEAIPARQLAKTCPTDNLIPIFLALVPILVTWKPRPPLPRVGENQPEPRTFLCATHTHSCIRCVLIRQWHQTHMWEVLSGSVYSPHRTCSPTLHLQWSAHVRCNIVKNSSSGDGRNIRRPRPHTTPTAHIGHQHYTLHNPPQSGVTNALASIARLSVCRQPQWLPDPNTAWRSRQTAAPLQNSSTSNWSSPG